MPINKINVSFDIDMDVFVKMLQHGNSGMHINVFGDTPKIKKDPKLLPRPERVGTKNIIMDYAKAHKDEGFRPVEVKPLCEAAGYSSNTHSPQLIWLKARKYLRRTSDGVYHVTEKGMTYGEG